MLTYQDLLDCGQDERRRMDFIRSAVSQHKSSGLYKTAVDAQLYYEGENPTITKYEKVIYTYKAAPMWICTQRTTKSRVASLHGT